MNDSQKYTLGAVGAVALVAGSIAIDRYSRAEKPLTIETLKIEGYEGVKVSNGYFIGVSDANKLEIRNVKTVKTPFQKNEIKKFNLEGKLVNTEENLEVSGNFVDTMETFSTDPNASISKFKLKKK